MSISTHSRWVVISEMRELQILACEFSFLPSGLFLAAFSALTVGLPRSRHSMTVFLNGLMLHCTVLHLADILPNVEVVG